MSQKRSPSQVAVAVTYMTGERAPKVVAKGRGLLAQTIIDKAKEAGVFVHESPELVSMLMKVDLDSYIPPDLYKAVAELLAWLYLLEKGDLVVPPPELSLPNTPAEEK